MSTMKMQRYKELRTNRKAKVEFDLKKSSGTD